MAAITVQLTAACAAGNHLTFAVTGAREMTVHGLRDVMLEPVSEEEAEAFLKVICKLVKSGRTLVQARNILQAGVTVSV